MFMRAQRFLSRNLTSVLAILMITSGLQILATTPASATNPVGSIQFDGNDSMVYSTGAPGSQNTTIEFWMKQTSIGGIQRIFTTSWSVRFEQRHYSHSRKHLFDRSCCKC
jgi:hypothetical protein